MIYGGFYMSKILQEQEPFQLHVIPYLFCVLCARLCAHYFHMMF